MQELEWMSSHPKEVEKYSGGWIAVTEKGITWDAAMLMKVPRKDEELMSA